MTKVQLSSETKETVEQLAASWAALYDELAREFPDERAFVLLRDFVSTRYNGTSDL